MGETNQLNDGLIDTMAEQMEINEKLKIIMSLLLPILSHSMGTKRTAGISTKDMTEVTIAAKVEVQPRSAKYVGSHPIVQ
jgi:pheromone shutdown protein TraB